MLIAHEECDPLFERFHAFLLTEFASLASKFTKHQHPLFGDDSVARGQMADGRLRLLLRNRSRHVSRPTTKTWGRKRIDTKISF